MSATITLERQPSREDLRAVVEASEWPCECDERARLLKDEVESVLCVSCKARKALGDLVKVSEGL